MSRTRYRIGQASLRVLLALAAIYASILPTAAAPPVGGTLSVEAARGDAQTDGAIGMFLYATARILSEKGFILIDGPGHAAYEMQLSVSRSDVGTGSGKVTTKGADVVNGGLLSGVGSGVIIPMPSRKSRLVAIERIKLDMGLRKRGEDALLWHGTAITVRSAAAQGSVASDLSNALLRNYPVQPEAVISLP